MSGQNISKPEIKMLPSQSMNDFDILQWHSTPQAILDIMEGPTLADKLSSVLEFGDLPVATGIPIALGGASGSGKSLTLAKLAARYARQAIQSAGQIKEPLVLACDDTPGSYEKLKSVLKGCRVSIQQPPNSIYSLDGENRIVLIDLPGINIYSPKAMKHMLEIIERFRARLSLVIPAGMDPEEAADIAGTFKECGTNTIIASRLEQSGRIGSVITAAACGLKLTYGSYSGNVNAGFSKLSAKMLAGRLVQLPNIAVPQI